MGAVDEHQEVGLAYDDTVSWFSRLRDSLLVQPRQIAKCKQLRSHCLNPQVIRDAAGVQRLAELGPRNTLLLPAATVLDQVALFSLLRVSVQGRVLLWFVTSENPAETAQLEQHFGELLIPLSDDATVDGDYPKLFGLKPTEVLLWQAGTGPESRRAFTDLDSAKIDRKTVRALNEAGIVTHKDSWFRRTIHNPQLAVYIIVFVYSALRALPVTFVKQFHGSLALLWAIDVFTAIPYTWGVLAMLFGKRLRERVLGTVTTIITFIAPYVYFWLHGKHYPPYVPTVIAVLTVITVLSELTKYIQERNLEKHYRTAVGLR